MLNLDTHILIHALRGQLNRLEMRLLSKNDWSISAIVLWEIAKLSQLKRIELDLDDREVRDVLLQIHIWPIDIDICREIKSLDFKGDPADEIIAATSIVHRIPLVTRDKFIMKSKKVPLALK